MLHTVVGRSEIGKRVCLNTIGPFWDGNEVWLIVAGAGTFAAFPDWYATWFSALYLALLLLLAALMARGVAFEWRHKTADPKRREIYRWCTVIGRAAIPLLLGVGLGDLLAGLPIDKSGEFTGNFFDLLQPYAIWVGLTIVGLSLLHGSIFLSLKTTDDIRDRAVAATR